MQVGFRDLRRVIESCLTEFVRGGLRDIRRCLIAADGVIRVRVIDSTARITREHAVVSPHAASPGRKEEYIGTDGFHPDAVMDDFFARNAGGVIRKARYIVIRRLETGIGTTPKNVL